MWLKLPERLKSDVRVAEEERGDVCAVGVDKGGGVLETKLLAAITDQPPILETDICL